MGRDSGDLDRTRRLGAARFEHAVRREIIRRGGIKPRLRIVRNLYAALVDPAAVLVHRRGQFRADRLADRGLGHRAKETGRYRGPDGRDPRRARVDRPGLPHPWLSAVGAAAIFAETGNLRRFTSARAVVKHAGLPPRERMSGTFTGKARLTGAGRPGLRVAAWRAMWGAMNNNEVYAERYRHLTTREVNKLKPSRRRPRSRQRSSGSSTRGHHRPRVEPDHRCRRPRQGREGSSRLRTFIARGRVTKQSRAEPSAASRTHGYLCR